MTQLHTAFSRDEASKVYVTHKLRQSGEEIVRLIVDENAYVYVCGDGARMAKDVQATLIALVSEHAKMTAQEAAAFWAALSKRGRHAEDVWS